MNRPNPEAALDQYSDQLKQRGATTKQITQARHFLRHLLTTLRDLSQDGAGYRRAAETTLRNFPDDENFLQLVREFYAYWSGDEGTGETSRPVLGHANGTTGLADALLQMDGDAWSDVNLADMERHVHFLKSLNRYTDALRHIGLDADNVAARARLIKLLLFTIRDAQQSTDTYRSGVDKVLAYIPHQERWHTFVSLAREFFYFLANDPVAPDKLHSQISLDELQELAR